MVESTIRYSKSGSSDIASNSRRQTPFWLQRLKRRKTLFQSPNTSGRPRQGEPVRTIQSTPSTNIRLSRPVDPFWSGRRMIRPDIRSQSASSNKLYRSRYAASRVNLSLPIIRVAPGFRSGGFGAPAPLAGLAAIAARRVRASRGLAMVAIGLGKRYAFGPEATTEQGPIPLARKFSRRADAPGTGEGTAPTRPPWSPAPRSPNILALLSKWRKFDRHCAGRAHCPPTTPDGDCTCNIF